MPMDLHSGGPSTAELARFAAAAAATQHLAVNPWVLEQVGGQPELLVGFTSLMNLWAPIYRQDPAADLAAVLVSQLREQWHPLSMERRIVDDELARAARFDQATLLRRVQQNLKRDAQSSPPQEQPMTQLLLVVAGELRRAVREVAKGGLVVVGRDNVGLAKWTAENLERFFRVRCALANASQRAREQGGTRGTPPDLSQLQGLPLSQALEALGRETSPIGLLALVPFCDHAAAPIRESVLLGLFGRRDIPSKLVVRIDPLAREDPSAGVRATALELLEDLSNAAPGAAA
ncbi:MAG: hypothetical protein HY904_15495 [Deltaproteobacteria bacterium]|nr:hypothetical protein [Deltaproteobacteria bacterium]